MQLPEQPGTEPRPGNKPLFYWGGQDRGLGTVTQSPFVTQL